uniref:Beta-1,4-galactosyltransferase n=1 Tax=Ciona savignyi TaxID=51511 RepID=H2ZR15_CIOSA
MTYFPGRPDNRIPRSRSYGRLWCGLEGWSSRQIAKTALVVLIFMQLPLFLYFRWRREEGGRLELTGSEMFPQASAEPAWFRIDDGGTRESFHRQPDTRGYQMNNHRNTYEAKISPDTPSNGQLNSGLPKCPINPPNLYGKLQFHFNQTPPSFEWTAQNNRNLKPGGFYNPPNCIARYRIAIIIPHRSREIHLRALMWHLHPILQRQQIYYKVYVIQQAYNLEFNKAKLMNIGYLEATKDDSYDCIVFHDVDLLLEDDRLLYHCTNTPKHLSVAIDKYGYRLPYPSLFGGVTMLGIDQFRDVNGYSNMFWGWGGEDDDMFARLFTRGYSITRPPYQIAKYRMSFHHRDKGNKLNLLRYEILSNTVTKMMRDGLNGVKYSVVGVDKTPLFTNITADVGTAIVQCRPCLSNWTCNLVLWMCENLGLSCRMLQYNSTDDGTLNLKDLGL